MSSRTVLSRASMEMSLPAWLRRRNKLYEPLVRRLHFLDAAADGLQTIGLTGCSPHAGVSTVAAHLGVAAAGLAAGPVLLVDVDVEQPSFHRFFRLQSSPGLVDVVSGRVPANNGIQRSSVNNLSVMTCGTATEGLTAAFDQANMQMFLETAKQDFEWIFFDLGRVTEGPNAFRLAGLLDGILLVVESEQTRPEIAQDVNLQLAEAQARLLGVVLNKHREYLPRCLAPKRVER